MSRIFIWCFLAVAIVACMPKIDSLWFDRDFLKTKNFNAAFLSQFQTRSNSYTHLGLFSDSHQNYDDFTTVVERFNQRTDLDGVIGLGDFTNQAQAMEFRYFLDLFSRLRLQKYSVIGNHDCIGLGPDLYQHSFGPLNQDFETDLVHFIFFNNNKLEMRSLDLDWLETVLAKPTTGMKAVFMHVNYDNTDYFTADDTTRFLNLMKTYNVGLVVNGHRHVYHYQLVDTVPILQVHRAEGVNYATVEIERTSPGEYDVDIHRCTKNGCALAESYHFVE